MPCSINRNLKECIHALNRIYSIPMKYHQQTRKLKPYILLFITFMHPHGHNICTCWCMPVMILFYNTWLIQCISNVSWSLCGIRFSLHRLILCIQCIFDAIRFLCDNKFSLFITVNHHDYNNVYLFSCRFSSRLTTLSKKDTVGLIPSKLILGYLRYSYYVYPRFY